MVPTALFALYAVVNAVNSGTVDSSPGRERTCRPQVDRRGTVCIGGPAGETPRASWVGPHAARWRLRAGESAGLRPWTQALPSTPVRSAYSTVRLVGWAGRVAGHIPALT